MGYNLFLEHRDTKTQSYLKVRETTNLGKGMALCLRVSVFQRKEPIISNRFNFRK